MLYPVVGAMIGLNLIVFCVASALFIKYQNKNSRVVPTVRAQELTTTNTSILAIGGELDLVVATSTRPPIEEDH